ncbi:hypothetical protein AB0B67_45685, partial [Streptomyces spectabilis]
EGAPGGVQGRCGAGEFGPVGGSGRGGSGDPGELGPLLPSGQLRSSSGTSTFVSAIARASFAYDTMTGPYEPTDLEATTLDGTFV